VVWFGLVWVGLVWFGLVCLTMDESDGFCKGSQKIRSTIRLLFCSERWAEINVVILCVEIGFKEHKRYHQGGIVL
jgi:hypothetical protein